MQLAIVCDKYDCAAVVKQWVALWQDGWTVKPNGPSAHLQRLFIAWVFGVEEEFELSTLALVSKISFEDDQASAGSKKKKKCEVVKSTEGRGKLLAFQFGEYTPSIVLSKLLLSSLVDLAVIDTWW